MNQNKTKLKNIEKNTNKRIIKMRKHKNRQIYKQTERQTDRSTWDYFSGIEIKRKI